MLMKRYIYSFLVSLLLPLCAAAQTEGYNPVNPPNPSWDQVDTTKYYTMAYESIPRNAGRFSMSSPQNFRGTQDVIIKAENTAKDSFVCWKDEKGEVISTNPELSFQMPYHDVKVYAIFDRYDDGPGNPVLVNNYMLRLKSNPEVAGHFNISDGKIPEGSQVHLNAYANSGFMFKYWVDEDGYVVSTISNPAILMPSHDYTLTAVYDYAPEPPVNPGTNLWDNKSGELIVDYFTAGSLMSAMDNKVGSSNRSQVTHFILDGEMNNNDWGFTSYYTKLTYIDMSHAYGSNIVPANWLDGNVYVQEVELPSGITVVRSKAFRNCSSMRAIDIYATTPPEVAADALEGLPADMVLYVPEESVTLYENALPWNQFTISPLRSKVCALELRLPEECKDGRYKNASLELVNVKSGQRFKYVVTDRLSYTFTTLLRNSRHKAYVKNQTGAIICESDTIVIENEDETYTFSGMKMPYDVRLRVLGNGGEDLTSKMAVTWNTEDGTFLCQGDKVTGQLEGAKLAYSIVLPQTLASTYVAPASGKYEVVAGENVLTLVLTPIVTMPILGVVVDDMTGVCIPGAHVLLENSLGVNGTVSTAAETDERGEFNTTARVLPTVLRVTANGYIPYSHEYTVEEMQAMKDGGDPNFGTIRLAPISGVTAFVSFEYTSAAPESEESVTKTYFEEQANVSYTLYNKSLGKAISDFIVDGSRIYLLDGASEGHVIEAVCTSANGKFAPTQAVGQVNANKGVNLTFHITEYGKLYARFLVTDNAHVEGLLYDSTGKLVRHERYHTNFTPTESDELGDLLDHNKTPNFIYFSDLADGEYTLVSIGSSTFLGNIGTLEGYHMAGLVRGTDYICNDVTIKDGVIEAIRNVVVPQLHEEKFYYTGENTRFSVNKANVVEGNFLTLSAKVDFQKEYIGNVKDVRLIVNLHPNSPMVEGSVVVGNKQMPYEYLNNVVTIPLGENYTDRAKFCVNTTSRGNYSPDAYVEFVLTDPVDGDRTLRQPIGSANYTVTDVSIWTAPLISLPNVFVDGNAAAMSEVIVYDNGQELGRTTALADGYWSLQADLAHCTNLSIHEIQARVTSPSGLVRQTEMRPVEYNERSIQAKDVDMRFYNGRTVWVDFDLEHVKANVKTYSFVPNTEFVFTADLTNNDPKVVHSCVIHVFTTEHEWIDLDAQYIPNRDRWVAHGKFASNQAPIGVRVTVDADIDEEPPYEDVKTPEPPVEDVEEPITIECEDDKGDIVIEKSDEPDPTFLPVDTIEVYDNFGNVYMRFYYDEKGEMVIVDDFMDMMMEMNWIMTVEEQRQPEEEDSPEAKVRRKAPIATEMVTRLKESIVALENQISYVNGYLTGPDVAKEKLSLVRSLNMLTRILHDGIKDVNAWQAYISRLQPCNGLDDAQAKAMLWQAEEYKTKVGNRYLSCCNLADIAAELAKGMWVDEKSDILGQYLANVSMAIYKKTKAESRNRLRRAKRVRNGWDCKYATLEEIDDEWIPTLPYPIVEPIIDPSGYVYEGVSSNRLEGVTATAYYKRTYEDEYGDLKQEVVLWDATQYSQENPLYTDADGLYQWDVPQGLWQVKFEKAGYQTTYSDWLPVPPPQMDVNVGMVQASQPEVTMARAYESSETTDGSVVITFDKYMKPASLNAENIYLKGVKAGEESLLALGDFSFPDMEVSIEGSTDTLATKVSVATQDLSLFDEVHLIVSRDVESYAGIHMRENFMQKLDVEKKLVSLAADSLVNIGFGSSKVIRIAGLPTAAAVGKKVVVTSASSITASIGEDDEESVTVTLDADGQAEITVNGTLFGTTALKMQVVSEDVEATTMVSILDPSLLEPVKAPEASRLSGTSVYKGQTVAFTCESNGSQIYYTTDGTCPCDSKTRKLYTGPVAIDGDVDFKVMSVSFQGEESEVREFSYSLRQSELKVDIAKGWNWASHDKAEPLAVSTLESMASVVLTEAGEEFVAATSAMKISAPEATQLSFSGAMYNPALEEIALTAGWNWLGYPINEVMTLDDALHYLPLEEGDVIANIEEGFSVYTAGKWVGDLKVLRPGQGYMFKSQSNKAFLYNTVPTVNARAIYGKRAATLEQSPWQTDVHCAPDMMCVVANLYESGCKEYEEDWLVGAFVGDECRGVGRFIGEDLYLPVRGKVGEKVTFEVISLTADVSTPLREQPAFVADALGTPENPVALTFSDPNGMDGEMSGLRQETGETYNLLGQRINRAAAHRGMFIKDGRKVLR